MESIDKKLTALNILKRYGKYWALKATMLLWLVPLSVVIYLRSVYPEPLDTGWELAVIFTATIGLAALLCDLIIGSIEEQHFFPALFTCAKNSPQRIHSYTSELINETAVYSVEKVKEDLAYTHPTHQPKEEQREMHIWK